MKDIFSLTGPEKILTSLGMFSGAVLLIVEISFLSTLLLFVSKLLNY